MLSFSWQWPEQMQPSMKQLDNLSKEKRRQQKMTVDAAKKKYLS